LGIKAVEILFERIQKKNRSKLYRCIFNTEIIERSTVKNIN
jgi:DNA-binding LacI/PurR family transcriptional regulator